MSSPLIPYTVCRISISRLVGILLVIAVHEHLLEVQVLHLSCESLHATKRLQVRLAWAWGREVEVEDEVERGR